MEPSAARDTLREFPGAAGVYDRVPFAAAAAVWTLDTSTDIFLLHSFQVGVLLVSAVRKVLHAPGECVSLLSAKSCMQQGNVFR
jgi:hypothetical protein